jgi:hypothetical protein
MFVEMMTQEASVRTVVIGGRPEPGPMQAASGSRGALVYSAAAITSDISLAIEKDKDVASRLPTKRNDSGMYVIHAGINLRDQVRPRDPTPLQFQYLPADCRLYWTFENAYNMTRLWEDVSTAAFEDDSRCVESSTGVAKSKFKPTFPPAAIVGLPEFDAVDDDDVTDITLLDDPDPETSNGLQAASGERGADSERGVVTKVTPCDPHFGSKNCTDGATCQRIPMECDAKHKGKEYIYACAGSSCVSNDPVCKGGATEMRCWTKNKKKPVESKANSMKKGSGGSGSKKSGNESISLGENGVCIPKNPTATLCKSRYNLDKGKKKPASGSTSSKAAAAAATKEAKQADDEE